MDLSRIENQEVVAAIQQAEAQIGANNACQTLQVALRDLFSGMAIPLTMNGEVGPGVELALNNFHQLLIQRFLEKVQVRAAKLDMDVRTSKAIQENEKLRAELAALKARPVAANESERTQ